MNRHIYLLVALVFFWTIVSSVKAQTPTTKPDRHPPRSEMGLRPLLKTYCYQCHGDGEDNGDVSLDTLATEGPEVSAESWVSVRDVINSGDMPPEDELQITDEHRESILSALTEIIETAAQSQVSEQPVIRKLTRAQYTNSLQNLLGMNVDFGEVLPEDGKSEMGFSNNAEVLQTTSLHFDYYEKVARAALNKAIATGPKPETYRFRISFGADIDADQPNKSGKEIGGFQSVKVSSDDFQVELLDSDGNRRKGADEAEEKRLRKFENNIAIGMRGSATDRFKVVKEGMLLLSAVPHQEVAPKSWQGPSPNLKVLVQNDFPRSGDFRMEVKATKSQSWGGDDLKDRLISLRELVAAESTDATIRLMANECKSIEEMELKDDTWLTPKNIAGTSAAKFSFKLPKSGLYQIDFDHPYVGAEMMPSFEIKIDRKMKVEERLQLSKSQKDEPSITTPVTFARLEKGRHSLTIGGRFFTGFKEVRITPLDESSEIVEKLQGESAKNEGKFADKSPSIAAFAGTRTDDGMDYRSFGATQTVDANDKQIQSLEFIGRLENLPLPVFEAQTRESLSNISIFGIWNNYLVKSVDDSGPPVVVKSIEIELPWNPVWPPASHTMIFSGEGTPEVADQEKYTREVLQQFITKAFRRPVEPRELNRYFEFWKSIRGDFDVYENSVKEVLVAVLCSPNFLYMVQPEATADLQDANPDDKTQKQLDQFLLASKLSYFLWNSPPDETLLKLASDGKLQGALAAQTDRMIEDPKVWRMIRAFAGEWLRVDRHENIQIDTSDYSDFTRFVKADMTQETWQFIHHVLQNDLPISTLIDSDFAMLNQNLAEFYGIADVEGNEFRPVKLTKDQHRGGLLLQGAFLSGHSDGQQAHPIKRAVWLKEKILGDPPPPAPPNVPDLDPETPGFELLTLKEQLELHRSKPSCISCHNKIDPYGVVFQNFDAVGRFQTNAKGKSIDATSTLPDGTNINGVAEMKRYILKERSQEFCRSLVEHLMAYSLGRDIKYSDDAEVKDIVRQVEQSGGSFRSVFRAIVLSQSFSDKLQAPQE